MERQIRARILPFLHGPSRAEAVQAAAGFAAGILIYLPMLTRWLGNGDAVWNGIWYKSDYAWETSCGRFGLQLVGMAKGWLVIPWLSLLFCLAAASLTGVMVCRMLEIVSVPGRAAASALVLLSPQFSGTLTYYYTADAYLIGFVAAVAAALLLRRAGTARFAGAVALLAVSLSIYQAYICVAICLVLFSCLLRLLRAQPDEVLRDGLRACAGIAGGTVLYLALFRLITLAGFAGDAQAQRFGRMAGLPTPALIADCCKSTLQYYFTDNLLNNRWMGRAALHLIVFGAAAALYLALLAQKGRTPALRPVLAALLLLAAPVALMFIRIMAPDEGLDGPTALLMLPQMFTLYLFAVAVLEQSAAGTKPMRLARAAAGVALALVLWVQLLWTGAFESLLCRNLATAETTARQVTDRAAALSGHTAVPVMVVGSIYDSSMPVSGPLADICHGSIAAHGMFWSDPLGANSSWQRFLQDYLGLDMPFADGDVRARLSADAAVRAMPVFPAEGSVQLIEGVCAVRLG